MSEGNDLPFIVVFLTNVFLLFFLVYKILCLCFGGLKRLCNFFFQSGVFVFLWFEELVQFFFQSEKNCFSFVGVVLC